MAVKKSKDKNKKSKSNVAPKNEISDLIDVIKRMKFKEYSEFSRNPWKIFGVGMIRGLGFGLGSILGASVLTFFIVYLLRPFFTIPILGEWVKTLIEFINK